MNAVVVARRAIPTLKDPKLLREHCYIDGEWVEANDSSFFEKSSGFVTRFFSHHALLMI